MKKLLIGALVGSLVLFFWQFLSWQALNLHGSQMQYTPNQDTILAVLEANLPEEGAYFIPRAPMDASPEQQMELMQDRIGKPWAQVMYHKSMSNNMGMNLFRGWVTDFLAALLLCWVLMRMTNLDFRTALLSALAVGIIGYLTIPYLNSVWFETNTIPDLIDAIVPWGIIGAWLGWWLPR